MLKIDHKGFLYSEGKQESESKINVNNIIRKGRDDESDGRKERKREESGVHRRKERNKVGRGEI